MKTIIPILLLLATAAGALAETAHGPWVFMSGGLAVPTHTGEGSLQYETGFGSGIGIGAQLSGAITVLASFNLDYFDLTGTIEQADHNTPFEAVVEGGNATNVYLSGGIRLNGPKLAGDSMQLYAVGGAGLSRYQQNMVLSDPLQRTLLHEPETSFAMHIGGGIDFSVGRRLAVFGEAYYFAPVGKHGDISYVPIRAGFAVHMGSIH